MIDIDTMSGGQLLGLLLGALLGYIVAVNMVGAKYRYLGGDLMEMVEEPADCLTGCVVTLLAVAIGAGAGYVLGGMLGG